jgi:hypothetical protein
MKPGAPSLQSPRLLAQVRKRMRSVYYSLKNQNACLYLIRFFSLRRHSTRLVCGTPRRWGRRMPMRL